MLIEFDPQSGEWVKAVVWWPCVGQSRLEVWKFLVLFFMLERKLYIHFAQVYLSSIWIPIAILSLIFWGLIILKQIWFCLIILFVFQIQVFVAILVSHGFEGFSFVIFSVHKSLVPTVQISFKMTTFFCGIDPVNMLFLWDD